MGIFNWPSTKVPSAYLHSGKLKIQVYISWTPKQITSTMIIVNIYIKTLRVDKMSMFTHAYPHVPEDD